MTRKTSKSTTRKRIVNLSVLVDVLMIMIFSFIMQSSTSAQVQKETYKEELQKYQDELEKQSTTLIMSLSGGLENTRTITFEYQGQTDVVTFNSDSRKTMQDRIVAYLKEKNTDDNSLFVTFFYDGGKAYALDVSMIENAVKEARSEKAFSFMMKNASKL